MKQWISPGISGKPSWSYLPPGLKKSRVLRGSKEEHQSRLGNTTDKGTEVKRTVYALLIREIISTDVPNLVLGFCFIISRALCFFNSYLAI